MPSSIGPVINKETSVNSMEAFAQRRKAVTWSRFPTLNDPISRSDVICTYVTTKFQCRALPFCHQIATELLRNQEIQGIDNRTT